MTLIASVITAFITFLLTRYFFKKKYVQLAAKNTSGKWTIDLAKKTLEASPDTIYLIDREYRMKDILNYVSEEIPLDLNELLGELAYRYIDEKDHELVIKTMEDTFNSDDIREISYSCLVDEKRFYFIGRFKRINNDWIICRSQNITKDKKYEMELLQAQSKLEHAQKVTQLTLDNATCGLVYIDTNFMVQFENLHSISKEGFDLDYKKGEYCYQRVRGESKPCEDCIAKKALETGKIERSKLIIHDDLHFEVSASPISAPDGTFSGVVLKYDDATLHEKAAQELQRAKEAAEASDKLKSQFLSNMSHEIRTPLNAIVGFSDLLMSAEDEEEKSEYMSIIKRNNELLLQLINDILDLSRIESDRLEFSYTDVHVNLMLNSLEASSNFRLRENPDVKVVFNEPSTECIIHTEENRTLQVLSNFVNNAIKFTEKGTIEIGYKVETEGVRFYVSDTGSGIPQEKQAQIFQRFVKLNEFINGTGLGLSICESIIKRLNGEIGVDSVEGEGSTFWFTLPVTPIVAPPLN